MRNAGVSNPAGNPLARVLSPGADTCDTMTVLAQSLDRRRHGVSVSRRYGYQILWVSPRSCYNHWSLGSEIQGGARVALLSPLTILVGYRLLGLCKIAVTFAAVLRGTWHSTLNPGGAALRHPVLRAGMLRWRPMTGRWARNSPRRTSASSLPRSPKHRRQTPLFTAGSRASCPSCGAPCGPRQVHRHRR
jgi:hypothetical protein